MATLVFDIMTVGHKWEALSQRTRAVLTRQQTHAEAETKLGLSPLTGSIIMLGLYDVERGQGMVYGTKPSEHPLYKVASEREILQDFWEGARSYDVFVTFGGRRFDVPWLLHRSLVCSVKPTITFPVTREVSRQSMPYHVDLHDSFSGYGSWSPAVSLHLLSEANGVVSPDLGGVTGETVGEFFQQEKFTDLAAYTERNVTATHQLYKKWLEYLAPPEFLTMIL